MYGNDDVVLGEPFIPLIPYRGRIRDGGKMIGKFLLGLPIAGLLGVIPMLASAALVSPQSPLRVAHWSWTGPGDASGGPNQSTNAEVPNGPVYSWLTMDGGPLAVDDIRQDGALRIEVHWVREGGAAVAAPNLTTSLTIADRGVLDRLEGEVRRQGYFQWHSWAEKETLSPGHWTVSLTYPDGQPVACGEVRAPCRLSIGVG